MFNLEKNDCITIHKLVIENAHVDWSFASSHEYDGFQGEADREN